MDNLIYLLFVLLLFAGYLAYFVIARRFQIVDMPNHRTMHDGATIRGGGVVLFLGMAVGAMGMDDIGLWFLGGLIIIALTGFLDDMYNLSGKIRLPLQVLSVLCIFLELELFGIGFFILFFAIVVAAGTLNAYNFMDGINGMTGGYSLVVVGTLLYVNGFMYEFIDNSFLVFFTLALLVFSFYNFRKKAVCFAGDVGSLSIAFIVVYLLIRLIADTHQFVYILLLTVYGIDTIFTIVQRIARKENIFDAHRLHLFQVIVSKTKMPHLRMSLIYMVIQLLVNVILLSMLPLPQHLQVLGSIGLLLVLSVIYIVIKKKMMPTSN
ncbi:MAG: UDP-GlcNAc--UDP-phosphate GlcNAc-1-phosphate transferase [Cyclobacteriaceae bacterium]|nr:UDP-GlcNAc--UDP-phosphate GlcNAc-1-phosphate transferase [Cyclobacteriaceae bacterium]